MNKVWVYINTDVRPADEEGLRLLDKDGIKIFRTSEAAEKWIEEHDRAGVAFSYDVLE